MLGEILFPKVLDAPPRHLIFSVNFYANQGLKTTPPQAA
jgi:hypothetical protein